MGLENRQRPKSVSQKYGAPPEGGTGRRAPGIFGPAIASRPSNTRSLRCAIRMSSKAPTTVLPESTQYEGVE
jgi:hypothetical protein